MKRLSTLSARVRCGAHALSAAIPVLALLAFAPLPASAQTAVAPTAGDGLTTGTAYQITELGNLVWLQSQITGNGSAGKYYKLVNDINASDTATWNDAHTSTATLEGFNPIGHPNGSGWPFNGVFLGQGHAITGLYICRPIDGVGLFGGVGAEGKVINLRLVGGKVVAGDHAVGGLVGFNEGAVLQCSNTGTVDGSESNVGGLVGHNAGGMISQCYATGDVGGSIGGIMTAGGAMGGLVGRNGEAIGAPYTPGIITQSYATGAVTTSGSGVGGLVGSNEGTLWQCHATGAVLGNQYVGGLTGSSGDGTISQCYATGAVTGNGSVGGLAGRPWYSAISRCYAAGAVKGVQSGLNVSQYVGGLAGECAETTISLSYATGAVDGHTMIGGLAGVCDTMMVSQCYAIGAVSGTEYVGGLIGNSGATTTPDSYWNTQTSGMAASAGGTGMTIAQMKQQSSFSNWDFTTKPVWGIQGAYPYLAGLTTCTLTYMAAARGQVGDGLTTGTSLAQIINISSIGTSVTAAPDSGHKFRRWSDGLKNSTRVDNGRTTDTSVTAIFAPPNTARGWTEYR